MLKSPRHRSAALGLLLILAPAAPAHAQSAPLTGLDAYIEGAMAQWDIPGLGIAVVRDDSVIYARGFGERTLGTGEPVDEHTLFAIASTTKAMTAAGLGMLVDDDVLHWDDPVTRWLPDFRLQDPWITHHLTVRDLLTHRIGLAREDNLWLATPLSRAEIVRRARHLPLVGPFRAGYGYNNIMFMVAGEVLASAAGTSWDDFLETRLFEPLGMTRTTSRSAVVETRGNVASSHTRSGDEVRAVARRDFDALGPAGSVFSSAHDMAQWLRLHLGGGEIDGRRLLADSTIEEMHTPQVALRVGRQARERFPSRNFAAYGLGWRVEDYHGRKVVQHTGNVNYTRTQVGMIPSEGIGVVVMANLSSSQLQTALMYRVFDALLGVPPTDWSAEYLPRPDTTEDRRAGRGDGRIEGTRPSLPLDDYTGTYADSLYGVVRVELEEGGLVLRYEDSYVADLEHWHLDTFRAVWREPRSGRSFATFYLDARARPQALDLQGYTVFRR